MNEADTRAQLIDKQLEAAGWITNAETGIYIRREYVIKTGEIRAGGTRASVLKADYVLEYNNIKLAVIEAKANDLDVGEGVMQAKLYAQKLQLDTSFAANGNEIYEINHKTSSEGKITAFPSPQALWQRSCAQITPRLEQLHKVPFQDVNGTKQARYYQELAVNRVLDAIAQDQQRILLTLATGTGKTFIAFQIAWKLFKTRWNQQKNDMRQPRILFLADRNILANQASLDFGTFDEAAKIRINPSDIAKRGEVPKNGNIFFTIFQTFMSGAAGKPYFGEYKPDFFDLIIIDECHRGGANDESAWRAILDYFSGAVHLGLTATPKRDHNTDTYDYFGDPVFTYSLKQGIEDGFLTPFKVMRIQTTLDEYVYAPDDEILDGVVEEGRLYKERDFNKNIIIEGRERKRVQEMLSAINYNQKANEKTANEKTIVFCANQAHAAMIRDLINQETGNSNIDYCVRVTANDGAQGDIYLRQFQDNEKTLPVILTTSQKLSTGVDARNIRNIVLMRPINSMIEFKQIIGRGTRLFEDKYFFTIIDFVNAYHLFNDPAWDGDPAVPPIIKPLPDDQDKDGGEDGGDEGDKMPIAPKLKIKLSDGKIREIQSMTGTYFYADGKPISAEDFIKYLFDTVNLPELLGSEHQLRTLWANPVTRRELLARLEEAGCYKHDLEKLQELINAKDSDLFDVLEYIAYSKPPISRAARVAASKDNIYNLLNAQQREFISYVLRNYVNAGIDELDIAKLDTVLRAKYGGLQEAQAQLGPAKNIQKTFTDFQKQLYSRAA